MVGGGGGGTRRGGVREGGAKSGGAEEQNRNGETRLNMQKSGFYSREGMSTFKATDKLMLMTDLYGSSKEALDCGTECQKENTHT